jgi:hypothetical protein
LVITLFNSKFQRIAQINFEILKVHLETCIIDKQKK